MRFAVYCNSEKRDIGEFEVEPGEEIDQALLNREFKPAADKYGKVVWKDGAQAICPACSSPLLVRDPDSTEMKGVYILPGGLTAGE